jgi:hypothetical protein
MKSYKEREKAKLMKELKKIKDIIESNPYKLQNYYEGNRAFMVPEVSLKVQEDLIEKGLNEIA